MEDKRQKHEHDGSRDWGVLNDFQNISPIFQNLVLYFICGDKYSFELMFKILY